MRSFTKRKFCLDCSPFGAHNTRELDSLKTLDEQRKDRILKERENWRISVKKRRKILVEKAIKLKGGKCQKCGYLKYSGALDFHHLKKEEKSFNIRGYGRTMSWIKIEKELEKCILLCANCHREIHGGLINIEDSSNG